MRILFPVGSLFPSQAGGPANTIYWLSKGLNTKGISTILISSTAGIQKGSVKVNKWLDTDYGKVIYCSRYFHYFPFRLIWHAFKKLSSVDIVHVNALFYPPSWIIAFAAKLYGRPVVWSVRGELHSSALFYSNYKKIPLLYFVKWLSNKGVHFHTTSTEELINVKAFFSQGTPVFMLQNYMVLPEKIDLPTDNYLLYIGRIHPIKGLENILAGLGGSDRFMNSCNLFLIAGEGEEDYLNRLKLLIKELQLESKVSFLGKVTGDQKQILYAKAKATLLLSHSENFGNVVVESLAQGTPVIASTGTPWQLLNETSAGYWISNSIKSISITINDLLSKSPADYQQFRTNSLQLAKGSFDIYENIEKWSMLYKNIIKN
jgi:glycosyltransferase involved in cell wall biosynthesis